MRSRWRNASEDEKGIFFLGALFLSTLTMLIVTVGLTRTFTEMRAATLNLRKTQDFHMAEAAIDYGIVEARRQVLTLDQFPTQLTVINPPTLPDIPGHYTFPPSTYEVTFLDPSQPREVTVGTGIPALLPYKGMKALVRDLRIRVNLEGPTGLWTYLESVSQFHLIPIYQFAEFDWNDWTFTPGPEMSITGAIYANGSIALGPDTGLTVDGTITTAKEFLHILPGIGYVNIKGSDANYHDMRNVDGSWLESIAANGMAGIAARWGGQVQAHAPAIPLPMPKDASGNPIEPVTLIQSYNASDTAELRKAKMFYQADLRIKDGNKIDANGNSLGPLPAGVVSPATFWDAREQKTMCVTDVDIGNLQSSIRDPGNGMVLYVESTQPACKNGVRIKNGAELKYPLTIVTHNPLYVVGDYNVGNSIRGTFKRPASLMADALTVLSSAWNDANATRPTLQRVAADTTVNAALMTSRAWQLESDTPPAEISRTAPYLEHGPASEHMIRFLENWDARTFTFTGSEVSPWDSREATSNLVVDTYAAPRRIWAFDQSFLTNSKLPPGTPKIHAVVIGSWRECAGGPCL